MAFKIPRTPSKLTKLEKDEDRKYRECCTLPAYTNFDRKKKGLKTFLKFPDEGGAFNWNQGII